jgi:hypothetical protein
MKRTLLAVLFSIFTIFFSRAQIKLRLAGCSSVKVLEENDLPGFGYLKEKCSGRTGVHFGFTTDLP